MSVFELDLLSRVNGLMGKAFAAIRSLKFSDMVIPSLWNFRFFNTHCRGLPFWLHNVQGIVFRTDNEPFKVIIYSTEMSSILLWFKEDTFYLQYHMKRYAQIIVKLMKSENLYASQGGPIILSQVLHFLFCFHVSCLFFSDLRVICKAD